MSPASLGMVTFRRHPSGVDDEAVLERINANLPTRSSAAARCSSRAPGCAAATSLRLCILNHSTSQAEVDRALELVATLAVERRTRRRRAGARELPADRGRAGSVGRRSTPSASARCRCSRRSTTTRPSASCSTRARAPRRGWRGVVEQWQVSRDLYVVLDRRGRGRRRRNGLWPRSARASSSASWRRSTGEPGSRAPARRRSPRPGRRACSCSTGCS